MSFTDQALFRARALEPVAAIGDVVFLIDQKGPVTKKNSPFRVIKSIEGVKGLGPHGGIALGRFAAGGASIAGYGLAPGNTNMIPEAFSATLAAGARAQVVNPKILQQLPDQLFQMRFAIKITALTGAVNVHDLEAQVYLPGALGKFGIANASPGYLNLADQFQEPADAILAPAQNAAEALPAAFPAMHQRDFENLTEMFIWEINGPTFSIINNGGATITDGMCILRAWGFRYDTAAIYPDSSWVNRWVYGQLVKAPPCDNPIRVIQTATFQAGSY